MLEISSFKSLYGRVQERSVETEANKTPRLILVGGCSRSGKSTVTAKLAQALAEDKIENHVVNLDCWLVGVDKRKPGSTVMERYDCNEITRSIFSILEGKVVCPPVYDPVSRKRIAERGETFIQAQSGIVLVDGVIALALKELFAVTFLKIFVSVSDDIRMERLKYFYTQIKGRLPEETENIITQRENEEVPFIKNTAVHADLVFMEKNFAHLKIGH